MRPEELQRNEKLLKMEAMELAEEVRKKAELEEWMQVLAQVDQDLKARHPAPDPKDFQLFVGDARVREKLQALRKACEGKQFSNIIDNQGHQYVDLVMEGGGTLGIALLGYLYALESANIRFLSVGGTSAGSITALLLASVNRDKSEARSETLFNMLTELDLASLLDSRFPAKQFIRSLLRQFPALDSKASWGARLSRRLRTLWLGFVRLQLGLWSSPALLRYLGLNPGKLFEERINTILRKEGVKTVDDLNARVAQPPRKVALSEKRAPGQEARPFQISPGKGPRLALIASEVSTGMKVVFPKMAPLFWKNLDDVSPASFVRASMAVPFFFHPMHRDELSPDKAAWKQLAGLDDVSGTSCTLVDGGIMSNFPISEFHSPIPPRTPTFGVKLGLERLEFQRIGTGQGYKVGALKQFGSALFNAARQTLDDDFLYNNPDYKKLITYINTAGHHWLNFSPSPAEQVNLFLRGVAAGAVFLSHFNWEEYKRVREHLYRAQVADGGVQADTGPEVDRGSPDGNGSEEEEPLRMPTRVPSALGELLPPPTSH